MTCAELEMFEGGCSPPRRRLTPPVASSSNVEGTGVEYVPAPTMGPNGVVPAADIRCAALGEINHLKGFLLPNLKLYRFPVRCWEIGWRERSRKYV